MLTRLIGYDDDGEFDYLNEENEYKQGYNDDNDTYDYANDDYTGIMMGNKRCTHAWDALCKWKKKWSDN